MTIAADARVSPSLFALGWELLKLGAVAFGGLGSTLALLQRRLVDAARLAAAIRRQRRSRVHARAARIDRHPARRLSRPPSSRLARRARRRRRLHRSGDADDDSRRGVLPRAARSPRGRTGADRVAGGRRRFARGLDVAARAQRSEGHGAAWRCCSSCAVLGFFVNAVLVDRCSRARSAFSPRGRRTRA